MGIYTNSWQNGCCENYSNDYIITIYDENNGVHSDLIGEFYNVSTANLLKDRLIKDIYYLNKKLNVKIAKKNQFQLISGPYNSINLLKKDYMLLKNFGFEELDILKNE